MTAFARLLFAIERERVLGYLKSGDLIVRLLSGVDILSFLFMVGQRK